MHPAGEDPEEQDDEDETDCATGGGKLLRRLAASDHLVAGKDDGTTVEGIHGQDVEYGQDERHRHDPPQDLRPPNGEVKQQVDDEECGEVEQHAAGRDEEPLPGGLVVDVGRRGGLAGVDGLVIGPNLEHGEASQWQGAQAPGDVAPPAATLGLGLVAGKAEQEHLHLVDAAAEHPAGGDMAQFVDDDHQHQRQHRGPTLIEPVVTDARANEQLQPMKCESAVGVPVLQLLVGLVVNLVIFHRCQTCDNNMHCKNCANKVQSAARHTVSGGRLSHSPAGADLQHQHCALNQIHLR